MFGRLNARKLYHWSLVVVCVLFGVGRVSSDNRLNPIGLWVSVCLCVCVVVVASICRSNQLTKINRRRRCGHKNVTLSYQDSLGDLRRRCS